MGPAKFSPRTATLDTGITNDHQIVGRRNIELRLQVGRCLGE
jgi:hypothetical protein